MGYIAHKDGERVQTVKEHLEGTAERAGNFAEKFGKREWGYCCGMLHDIGKYSKEFQKKIQENTNDKVDHATAGAQVCKELGGYYPILSYCIAGHHAGLPDYGNTAISSSLCGRWKKKICDYQDYKDEVEIPDLDTEPITFKEDRNMDFSLGTFIRMLYSCLVDADFLDTESFMKNGDTGRNSGETMVTLQNRLKNHISEWLKNTDADTINGRRTEILSHCIKEGKQKEGIFRLTVPTGGGKTVASLAFALEHAVKNHKDRIIYVIPYTSIIEQNAQVFREILGEENVLENHYNVDYESSEEFKPMQLASENWDKPVVVTTNVQFFESLFANKSSKCRKIHNIANSVVIFDEAQMLPMDYLKPCIAMLQELVDSYSVSIVLCTATQPALDSFFSKNELIKELCPRMEEQFLFFKRVNYQNLGRIREDDLLEKLKKENNALCIVNTKKAAQMIYKELQGEGIYHLSTSMYPKHRKRKRELSESMVYIFDLEESYSVPNQRQQIDVSKGILQDYTDIADLKAIHDYFTRLYHYRGTSLDKKKIMDEFQKMECNFAEVAKEFKLIEENTKTIFINREPEADELLQELRIKGVTRERMRKAGQYCIQIYDNAKSENSFFDRLNGAGMLRPVSEEMQDFYELVDGEQYSEEYGLDFSLEDGMAFFV